MFSIRYCEWEGESANPLHVDTVCHVDNDLGFPRSRAAVLTYDEQLPGDEN